MQVVIIGAGKVGIALAEALLKREDDVVLIDQGESWLDQAKHLECKKISGVVIDKAVLTSADIEDADAVCAVTQSDNINIMASLMAKHVFAVDKVISRLYNPEKKRVFQELGLDTINSTAQTVSAILRNLDGVTELMTQELFGQTIAYHQVDLDPSMIGSRASDIVTLDGEMVLGVVRDGVLLPASETVTIEDGDALVLIEVSA